MTPLMRRIYTARSAADGLTLEAWLARNEALDIERRVVHELRYNRSLQREAVSRKAVAHRRIFVILGSDEKFQ